MTMTLFLIGTAVIVNGLQDITLLVEQCALIDPCICVYFARTLYCVHCGMYHLSVTTLVFGVN